MMPTAAAIETIDRSCTVTQAELRRAIREAQIALVDDRATLAEMDPRVYEALHQFFRVAWQTEVDRMPLAEVKTRMAKALDDRWAHQTAPGFRSGALAGTSKVIGALLKSPILVEIGKTLMARGI